MDNETFERLEKLNIDIDICIDEEKYKDACKALKLRDGLNLADCFPPSSPSTHNTDDKWNSILGGIGDLPIREADGVPLVDNSDPVVNSWSCLLYAKLIRARIQKMGTDCYLRRLDDVIAYLERNLPQVTHQQNHISKLSIFYLFELSSASQEYEMVGFARRAKQILLRQRRTIGKDFYWFYDLLAHYNYGVAYFHGGRYRLAVREFNYIIRSVKELNKPENSSKKKFFIAHEGSLFLFLPSVLYRADIQIKLQLAYHSLDTLHIYFKNDNTDEVTLHKKIRAELIKAEAYQQMYDIKKSWDHLSQAFKYISELERVSEELRNRTDFAKLPERFSNRQFQNVKSRFIDIFIEDHLTWLEMTFGPITEEYKPTVSVENRFENAESSSNMLQSAFSDIYFKVVKYNTSNRNGYYQQLAQLLAWLTKKYEIQEERLAEAKDGKLIPEFCKRAQELYLANRPRLMQSEKYKREVECPDCEWLGIELERLESEHHKWFTEYMFDFYESMEEYFKSTESMHTPKKQKEGQVLTKDKEEFIKRLLEIERGAGQDRRITDLELRYKLDSVTDKLVPDKNYRALCQGELQQNPSIFNKAFANLLACVQSNEFREELIDSRQYEQIMKRWADHYTHHLKYKSTHQWHKNGLYFISLQRWNSSSPAQGRSIGGGYLLYKTDEDGKIDLGVAIDPGFDFVRNLFHMGFSLDDIDIILISHAHADHIRDFESIAIMLYELKKRDGKKKKIHVILTLGAYERLEYIIEDPTFRFFIEPYIIDVHKEIDPAYFENLDKYVFHFEKQTDADTTSSQFTRYRPEIDPNKNSLLSICPTRAYHDDSSLYSDSFGFLMKVNLTNGDEVSLGYTGDTKWVYPEISDPLNKRVIEEISKQYKDCETVVIHLGSLIGGKKSFNLYNQCENPTSADECERLVKEENHPYLVGMLRLLSGLYRYEYRKSEEELKQLILLGEFGEELRGGIRIDLVKRLRQAYGNYLAFLPLDVGMDIQLWPKSDPKGGKNHTTQKVWCVQCEEFVDIEEADFERYGVDEALYCVCKTCRKATPLNVLQDRLHQLYEVGRELKTRENR